MKSIFVLLVILPVAVFAQLQWKNVDSLYQPLPASVHIFRTNDSLYGKPNIAYYVEANLKDKQLQFTSDTTSGRRLTPLQFYNRDGMPLVVVNCTFFEFVHNSNLNVVIKDGRMLSYNLAAVAGRGKDTFTYRHTLASALGISKRRSADVAWLFTDSSKHYPYASQTPMSPIKDSIRQYPQKKMFAAALSGTPGNSSISLNKWKMNTAVGGGPVILQNGVVKISNNEELKFGGKAIDDKHPRTCMGYTKDGKLIIMVIQGRFPGIAEGATLVQEAQLLKDVGCWEALNLDGGGSSCMLVNGKETIKPSDKEGERSVPAVFIVTTN